MGHDEDMSEQETEPTAESEDNTQTADAGVPGQILYPERVVDAERAGAFVAGDVDTLEPEEDEEGIVEEAVEEVTE